MNILILHRVPYERIDYARGIDHSTQDVTYFGIHDILSTLPYGLRCRRVERPGESTTYDEAKAWIEENSEHFDRVISMSEYELLDAARLRQWLNVPGPQLGEVILVRDKVQMKHAVARSGLRVPRFLPLPDFIGFPTMASWTGKTVLKPLSGASSEDVVLFDSPAHLLRMLSAHCTGVSSLDEAVGATINFEVEEFINGDIVHFDGLVANGELLTATASRYVGTCLDYAQGGPLGSFHFPISPTMREWVASVLSAVCIDQGSFHLEAIENNGLVFLEVGNRVGGADVVPTFEMATGVHLPSEELRIILDGRPSRPLPVSQLADAWHGWFVFPGHVAGQSTYRPISGIDRFRHDSSVVRWAELEPGTTLTRKLTYSANEAPLTGIVAHRHWEETHAWLKSLFRAAEEGRHSATDITASITFRSQLTPMDSRK